VGGSCGGWGRLGWVGDVTRSFRKPLDREGGVIEVAFSAIRSLIWSRLVSEELDEIVAGQSDRVASRDQMRS
jgi:hypothetical protein